MPVTLFIDNTDISFVVYKQSPRCKNFYVLSTFIIAVLVIVLSIEVKQYAFARPAPPVCDFIQNNVWLKLVGVCMKVVLFQTLLGYHEHVKYLIKKYSGKTESLISCQTYYRG